MLLTIAAFVLMLAHRAPAQTFTVLHRFSLPRVSPSPLGLAIGSNVLYGVTARGGSPTNGTVFSVNTDGSSFATIYTFSGGSDGGVPFSGVILSGNTLYGTTYSGGSSTNGTVFSINTDGSDFTTLHSFTGASGDGTGPIAGLILSGSILYGTTSGASVSGGTVFAINTDGTGFTNLHSFSSVGGGSEVAAELILSGNTLYGTTVKGGSMGSGSVYALNTDGTGFATLYSFTNGTDGELPHAGLLLSSNTLYGTAQEGGVGFNSGGTVFKVNTDGSGFSTLHSFHFSDGGQPIAGLVVSGNVLYGTTFHGGVYNGGTVFKINLDGTGFATLYSSFTSGANNLNCRLVSSGTTFYGTAENAAVFSFNPSQSSVPPLTITASGTNVILTWPTNAAASTLEYNESPTSPADWTIVYPPPVAVNGLYSVTNPVSSSQRFYRLIP